MSAQRVNDWVSDTAGRAKVPSRGSSEQVWALVRLWSHWAGEVPNEPYWRALLDRAQPAERGRATAPADTRSFRDEERRPSPTAMVSSLRMLPRDVTTFTGRNHELDRLVAAARSTRGVTVRTVDGMPGVGKTALVTRAAHLLADRFPDGQIFIRLHAHTPGQRPAEPAEVLAGLLAPIVGPAQQIPVDLDSRAALWRGHLSGRRMLLVLDDAVDHVQVEPLLPAVGDCLVLVTSRRRLIAMESATPLSLEILPQRQAVELFTRLTHRADTDSNSDAEMIDQMVRLCGRLPLAIALLAGRLAHHPAWSIAELAADFIATRDRLDELHAGDRTVAAAFELSYRDLPADRQRLFRRIGLHPGPDIDARATAALDGISLARARRELEALYTDHLIDEQAPGRYRPHDLVREYARILTTRDPAEDRERATARLLDHYQHRAEAADRHLSPAPSPLSASATDPELSSREEALTWMHAERANLFACADHAAATGEHSRVMRLASAMTAFLHQEGPWQQAADLQERAVTAATRSGDLRGQASALTALGHVRLLTNEYAAAIALEERALALYRELGDQVGEARALTELGRVLRLVNDYPAATGHQRTALALQRSLGDRHGEAEALTELGFVRYRTNDYAEAAELQEQALTLYWNLGDRHGEAGALSRLGFVRFRTGDYPAAATLQDRARLIYWELGARQGEANVLTELGHIEIVTGRHARADEPLERALALYQDLGDRHGEADALTELGRAQASAGNFAQALSLLEQALAQLRQLGDHLHEAYVLTWLGRVRTATGQHPEAAGLLRQALSLRRELGDARGEAEALNALGDLLVETADTAGARSRYEEALQLTTVVPNPLEEGRALEGLGRCHELSGALSDALTDTRAAVGVYRRLGAAEAEPAEARLARLTRAVRPPGREHPPAEGPGGDQRP
ncbi:ATP-binding protein [Streptomyces sp. NBC_01465]|uniref:ATP-binding protein n=1 Tax=Streptomyces sp. NBC_01465 TaxID=2903878 RepID=UPI002E2F8064|nr:tetratricopeptide repeat protein [Streptomyces sp. NBC_01465]